MKLDLWLFLNKITKKDFAIQLGVSRGHLQEIVSAKRTPSIKLAKKIEEITQGKVTKEELLFPEDYQTEETI